MSRICPPRPMPFAMRWNVRKKTPEPAYRACGSACAGAGLASQVAQVEIEIGGRRIEEDDVEHLLSTARDTIQPDGRMVLHAQPAHYTLDGAHGVANPRGLHAERLGVDIHVMLADGAPVRNLTEAVQNAHLSVEALVSSPLASGLACLSAGRTRAGRGADRTGGGRDQSVAYRDGMLRSTGLDPVRFRRYYRCDRHPRSASGGSRQNV